MLSKAASIKPASPPSQNGIPENSTNGIGATKKGLYPWQERIPFPLSKEYTDRLDKNGIYQPIKGPNQEVVRLWEDDVKGMDAYLKNLPNDKRGRSGAGKKILQMPLAEKTMREAEKTAEQKLQRA